MSIYKYHLLTRTPYGEIIQVRYVNSYGSHLPHMAAFKLNTANRPSNFANVSSLLWHAFAALPAPSSAVNWAGFYVRQDKFPSLASPDSDTKGTPSTQTLLLGPFHGKPACQLIQFGRGVCGTAAEKRETVLVPDVLDWEGHIACDAESRSEIVVPILVNGEVSSPFPPAQMIPFFGYLSPRVCGIAVRIIAAIIN